MKKPIIYLILLILLFSLQTHPVNAAEVPDFPFCPNPGGTKIADYNDGNHGIVGSNQTYSGSDTVFSLDDRRLVQCYCSHSGSGIQTNWWRYGFIDNDQMKILLNQGWHYIPNGRVWGLQDSAYITKNISYSCKGGIGGAEDVIDDPQILGLADTGTKPQIILFVLTGIGLLILSKKLRSN
jgi:hypothetical protein